MPTSGRPTYEDGRDIRDRSFDYACRVVGLCEQLDETGRIARLMVPQILSCSLSFAAMLEEARAAESDNDCISKCGIGLKECRESWTRLRVCERRRIGPPAELKSLVQEGNELISIVTAIIRNKRRNVAAKREAERAARAAERNARRDTHSKFQIPNS
ncbi:MAG TPA: four helix bundle protein [Vicinamibacterales bacterium]|nr:four helix bundle protein [Vicinamibacterales bacterium]